MLRNGRQKSYRTFPILEWGWNARAETYYVSAKVGQIGTRFLVGGGGWRGGWLVGVVVGWLVVGSRGVVRPFIQKIIICH